MRRTDAASGLAFPQAQGFGQHATGGRAGRVFHVTSSNDAGTGSFRDAVSQPNRIIVFDVGGYITLKTAVSVKSNLTIAGKLIIDQVATLGKGTTGTAAGAVGPSGGLYTSQTQTGLANNGYGDIRTALAALDTENDGKPDFWEKTTDSNAATDDAMQKASDGYPLIEHYLDWLAEPHATTTGGNGVDVDLAGYALGFADVAPVFSVSMPGCGAVQLLADKPTAHFTPTSGFVGLASFDFSVTGSDGSTFTAYVAVAVAVQP